MKHFWACGGGLHHGSPSVIDLSICPSFNADINQVRNVIDPSSSAKQRNRERQIDSSFDLGMETEHGTLIISFQGCDRSQARSI